MEKYESSQQLKEFGIIPLTGEACGLAMRVLCDVTQEGKTLLRDFFRMDVVAEAWNNGVGSVMLPYGCLKELWAYAQVRNNKLWVFAGNYINPLHLESHYFETCAGEKVTYDIPKAGWGTSTIFVCETERDREFIEGLVEKRQFYIERTYTKSPHPGTGLDNTHALSGRTE